MVANTPPHLIQQLASALRSGERLDLEGEGQLEWQDMLGWGADRRISADTIRDACLGRLVSDVDPHGLQLRGAVIDGRLDLRNVCSSIPIAIVDCILLNGFTAFGAQLASLNLTGCLVYASDAEAGFDFRYLHATNLIATGVKVDIRPGRDATVGADFSGAHIDNTINLDAAELIARDVDGYSVILNDVSTSLLKMAHSTNVQFRSAGAISICRAAITGGVDLSGARISGFDSSGVSIHANRMTVSGDVFMQSTEDWHFRTAGAINLVGSAIAGQLVMVGAQVGKGARGISLFGDWLEVGTTMFLWPAQMRSFVVDIPQPFISSGAIRLYGARIGGMLDLSGGKIGGTDEDGVSLLADGLSAAGLRFTKMDGIAFSAAGAIKLSGARVGHTVDMSGAKIGHTGPKDYGLICDGLQVGGALYLNASANDAFNSGPILISGASVKSDVDLSGARVFGADGTGNSINATKMTIGGDLRIQSTSESRLFIAGGIKLAGSNSGGKILVEAGVFGSDSRTTLLDLSDGSFGGLHLELGALGPSYRVDLDRATYAGIPTGVSLPSFLEMLRTQTPRYAPSAYQQFASVHRSAGHDKDAATILISQQDDRRYRILRPVADEKWTVRLRFWAQRSGLALQRLLIGYGYRTWPAFVGVVLFAFIGAGVGLAAGHTIAGSTRYPAAWRPRTVVRLAPERCSTIEQISVGVRIPFLGSIGDGDCTLATRTIQGEVYGGAIWSLSVLTWASAALAVAGYTGLVRRA
jgi:hypothetical protein